MDRDGEPDQQPEGLLDAERDSDADAFRERVDGHDPHDQEGFPRVRPLQRTEPQRAIGVDCALRHGDEHDARDHAERRASDPVAGSLVDEADARAQHQPGGEAVGDPELPASRALPERERESAETGRERGPQCDGEDREHIHRRSYLITDADARPAYFSTSSFGTTVPTGAPDMLPG